MELVWLAGLLEGEGWFGLHRGRPSIQIQMTDFDVMTMVANLFNRERLGTRTLSSGKITYRAWLEGNPAVDMMKMLLPHMYGRRSAKITEILEKANA